MSKEHSSLYGLEGTPLGSFGEGQIKKQKERKSSETTPVLQPWEGEDEKEPNTNIPANDIWRGQRRKKRQKPLTKGLWPIR